MSSKVPFRINEIDVNNICYTDVKSNDTKTIVYLKYMDNTKLKNIVFQTPNLLNVYNILQKKQSPNVYELDVPLKGKSDHKITKFIRFLNDIDKKIIKDARSNPQWFSSFPQQKTMKYQKIIRETDETEYKVGVIRFKILKTNDFNTIVQLNNKKINLLIDEIPKNCWVKSILEIYAIWINENGFGLFIRPIVMDFKSTDTIMYNYTIIDDSEEIDDIDDGLCTIQEKSYKDSVFIRSETEVSSVSSVSSVDDIAVDVDINMSGEDTAVEPKLSDNILNTNASSSSACEEHALGLTTSD